MRGSWDFERKVGLGKADGNESRYRPLIVRQGPISSARSGGKAGERTVWAERTQIPLLLAAVLTTFCKLEMSHLGSRANIVRIVRLEFMAVIPS